MIRSRARRAAWIVPALLLCTLHAQAATIRVPADHSTIQGAIDAASSGDTVLVDPGAYEERIDFNGKDIVVKASEIVGQGCRWDSWSPSIQDANDIAPIVRFRNGESRAAVLDGFLIRGGEGNGSAILIRDGSSPTIRNNCIQPWQSDLRRTGNKGTIHVHDSGSDPLFEQNEIGYMEGDSIISSGGGIYVENGATIELRRNRFEGIRTGLKGGAIYCENGAVTAESNFFFICQAGIDPYLTVLPEDERGGAVYLQDCPATFDGDGFRQNFAADSGSAIWSGQSTGSASVTIDGGLLTENTGSEVVTIAPGASSQGHVLNSIVVVNDGGVRCDGASACTIEGTLIANNAGNGLVPGSTSTTQVTNSTITYNNGWGISCGPSDQATIVNSIVYFNTTGDVGAGSGCTATYSDIGGGRPGVGNFDADPQFTFPAGPDELPGTLDDHFHLKGTSPCVDAGNGDLAPSTDLDGIARWDRAATPNSGAGTPPYTDIGVFEWNPDSCLDASAGLAFVQNHRGPCPASAAAPPLDVISGFFSSMSDAGAQVDLGIVSCVADDRAEDRISVGHRTLKRHPINLQPLVISPFFSRQSGSLFYLIKASSDPDYGTSSNGDPRLPASGACP